jgi:ribose transport system substrate-binding protein
MQIKRIGRWLGFVGMLLAAAGCQRDDGKLRVAFLSNNAEDFWSMAEKGTAQAETDINAANKDFQVAVEFRKPPNGNSSEQQEMMENLLGKGIKGIAVSPNNAANMVPFYRDKVVAKKVTLVMQDNDLPEKDHALRQCYIGTQNYHAGLAAGKLVAEACPDGGKIAIFVGKPDAQNAIERRQGVLDYLADPDPKHLNHKEMGEVTPWEETNKKFGKFVLVDTRIDEVSPKKCQESAEDLLGKHPDVACLVGLWEYNPPALLRAIKQSRIAKAPKVVAFDESLQTLEGIMSHDCYATVVQNPYEFGYQSIKFLVGAARGKKTEELLKGLKDSRTGVEIPTDAKNRVLIPYRVINKENVDAFDVEVRKLKGAAPRAQ